MQGRILCIQLFLQHLDVVDDVIDLFLVAGFCLYQVLHTLLFAPGDGNLLFEGSNLFADIRFPDVHTTEACFELLFPEIKLRTVHIAQHGPGFEPVTFLQVQFHNLSVRLRRNDYFGRFKCSGSIKVVLIAAASQQSQSKTE